MDDKFCAGYNKFQNETLKNASRFHAKHSEVENFVFARVELTTNTEATRTMHRTPYTEKLEVLERDAPLKYFDPVDTSFLDKPYSSQSWRVLHNSITSKQGFFSTDSYEIVQQSDKMDQEAPELRTVST